MINDMMVAPRRMDVDEFPELARVRAVVAADQVCIAFVIDVVTREIEVGVGIDILQSVEATLYLYVSEPDLVIFPQRLRG
jgi:predicted TIM-barrel enzyme